MRRTLPSRRAGRTVDLDHDGTRFTLTINAYPDGQVAEIFCHGAKVGSAMDAIVHDACILASLALQHGVAPHQLAAMLGRASIVGALLCAALGGGDA